MSTLSNGTRPLPSLRGQDISRTARGGTVLAVVRELESGVVKKDLLFSTYSLMPKTHLGVSILLPVPAVAEKKTIVPATSSIQKYLL